MIALTCRQAPSILTMVFSMCRFKFNTVHILDSGAAYFGSDNVGLCGIAWYFKVRADLFGVTCLAGICLPTLLGKICQAEVL